MQIIVKPVVIKLFKALALHIKSPCQTAYGAIGLKYRDRNAAFTQLISSGQACETTTYDPYLLAYTFHVCSFSN